MTRRIQPGQTREEILSMLRDRGESNPERTLRDSYVACGARPGPANWVQWFHCPGACPGDGDALCAHWASKHPAAEPVPDPEADQGDRVEAVDLPDTQDAATDQVDSVPGETISPDVEVDVELSVTPASLATIDVDDPPDPLPEPEPEPLVLNASEVAQVLRGIAGADLAPELVTDDLLRRWETELAEHQSHGVVRAALIGRVLQAKKKVLAHGELGPWVASLGIAARTASRYMAIADLFFRAMQIGPAGPISLFAAPIHGAERTLRAFIEAHTAPAAPVPGTASVPRDEASTTTPVLPLARSVRLKTVQSFLVRVRSWPVAAAEDREVISALVVELQALLAGAEAQA